jgi:hypothetical protein
MTIPRERNQAIHNTREFLRSLLDRKATKVPKEIREQAYWCLRHFPSDYEMDKAADKCPELFEAIPRSEEEL